MSMNVLSWRNKDGEFLPLPGLTVLLFIAPLYYNIFSLL